MWDPSYDPKSFRPFQRCLKVNPPESSATQNGRMGREIHYEIFKRVGARGGWTLHEVSSSRNVALNWAKELMTTHELRHQLRRQGIDDCGEVEEAVLESDGFICVLKKCEVRDDAYAQPRNDVY